MVSPVAAVMSLIERYEEQVNQLVNDDEDLLQYVERLETATDTGMMISDEVSDDQLQFDFVEESTDDDASHLVDEVERFLREQNGG